MKNYYFFRRFTLAIITSLFTLSFEITSVDSVNAQDSEVTSNTQEQDCSIPPRFAAGKLRIAVADFKFSATALNLNNDKNFYDYQDEVTRISDIIASYLARDNNFTVVERTQMKELYEEGKLCKIRQKFGVEAIIIGSITQFNITKRKSGGGFLGFGKATTNKNADVELNVRIINTATSEIVNTFVEVGNSNYSESNLEVPRVSVEVRNDNDYTNKITRDDDYSRNISDKTGTEFVLKLNTSDKEKISYSSTENEDILINSATKKAIDGIVTILNANYHKFVSDIRKVDSNYTRVAGIFGKNYVVLNHGKSYGYKKGMKFVIKEITKKIVDPQTKEVIRIFTLPIAHIELIDVDSKSSLAKILPNNTSQIIWSEEIRKQIEQGNIIAKPINYIDFFPKDRKL
ncbi:CsgG/HfaB family protein [Mastigocoleus testarum]|uniref:Curli production assembly/transport component CsgG n=1 Tax=Mastigocoleus testarum BC008 TaxID=371196 RepID=A0A0V7ZZ38_9CYAN|nr:CsgG/HfaB family protein [Mastigocoleus testarum]KST67612.1 hypothetical protein BC008_30935 [Mastigocoleus testarum BC008]KST69752.1 hypothetical protein BC008_35915 [Mastigocoleus testarum BC008]